MWLWYMNHKLFNGNNPTSGRIYKAKMSGIDNEKKNAAIQNYHACMIKQLFEKKSQ